MALTEDLTLYFADFGVDATLPSGAVVRGIFDNAFIDTFGVAETDKALTAASADVSALVYGDTITIASTDYTVAELQPDGTGITKVRLK
jgi:hypothetical protein